MLRSDTCMGVVKCDMAQVCVLWRVFAVCIVIVTRDVCCVGVIHTALCVVVECCAYIRVGHTGVIGVENGQCVSRVNIGESRKYGRCGCVEFENQFLDVSVC